MIISKNEANPEVNDIWTNLVSGKRYLIEGRDGCTVYARKIVLHEGTFLYPNPEDTLLFTFKEISDTFFIWGYLDENEEVALWP